VSREIAVAVDLGGEPPRFVTVRLPLSEEIGEARSGDRSRGLRGMGEVHVVTSMKLAKRSSALPRCSPDVLHVQSREP
jgi:hypothetical protein